MLLKEVKQDYADYEMQKKRVNKICPRMWKTKLSTIFLTKDLIQSHYTFLKFVSQLKKLRQKLG